MGHGIDCRKYNLIIDGHSKEYTCDELKIELASLLHQKDKDYSIQINNDKTHEYKRIIKVKYEKVCSHCGY